MKKKSIIFVLSVLVLMLALTACGKKEPNLIVKVNDNNTVSVSASKAKENSLGSAGGFVVGENEKIVVDSKLEKGHWLTVKLVAEDKLVIDKNSKVADQMNNTQNAALEIKLKGTEKQEHEIDPGTYMVIVSTEKLTTGVVTMSLEKYEPEDTEDEPAEESVEQSAEEPTEAAEETAVEEPTEAVEETLAEEPADEENSDLDQIEEKTEEIVVEASEEAASKSETEDQEVVVVIEEPSDETSEEHPEEQAEKPSEETTEKKN